MLTLTGATHLPTYTVEQPYLSMIQRVTIAFLDRLHQTPDRGALEHAHRREVNGIATLQADP